MHSDEVLLEAVELLVLADDELLGLELLEVDDDPLELELEDAVFVGVEPCLNNKLCVDEEPPPPNDPPKAPPAPAWKLLSLEVDDEVEAVSDLNWADLFLKPEISYEKLKLL